MIKKCTKCGISKSLESYYQSKSRCKSCCKEYSLDYYKRNREERLKYCSDYKKNNKDRYNDYQRIGGPQNEKQAIRKKARRALKSGKLTKQECEICRSTNNIEMHHDDYTKPLDVRFLCMSCHGEVHRCSV